MLRRLLRTGARENPDTWYNIVRRAPPLPARGSVVAPKKSEPGKKLAKGSMNLVLNRPHSKANELKVGTGEALVLHQARRGSFSRTDEELINYLHVTK